ncbi:hypothetical protein A9K75_02230 [Campylobacter fetus subsp. testudinum]|uniref:hypothetical protein n=1 Tax=Campylobacter fetus TaxID=196 RepID=UPI000818B64E|nr:hypothetical protein [Campylobacter fetus]OCS00801.1 hypothetical protein A9K75_02230 [Campylobacter fetus subsp. testudinum]OCS04151.1 hypothetical protein CFTCF782_02355 [Campylobacter fetus subsp. testudinum]
MRIILFIVSLVLGMVIGLITVLTVCSIFGIDPQENIFVYKIANIISIVIFPAIIYYKLRSYVEDTFSIQANLRKKIVEKYPNLAKCSYLKDFINRFPEETVRKWFDNIENNNLVGIEKIEYELFIHAILKYSNSDESDVSDYKVKSYFDEQSIFVLYIYYIAILAKQLMECGDYSKKIETKILRLMCEEIDYVVDDLFKLVTTSDQNIYETSIILGKSSVENITTIIAYIIVIAYANGKPNFDQKNYIYNLCSYLKIPNTQIYNIFNEVNEYFKYNYMEEFDISFIKNAVEFKKLNLSNNTFDDDIMKKLELKKTTGALSVIAKAGFDKFVKEYKKYRNGETTLSDTDIYQKKWIVDNIKMELINADVDFYAIPQDVITEYAYSIIYIFEDYNNNRAMFYKIYNTRFDNFVNECKGKYQV